MSDLILVIGREGKAHLYFSPTVDAETADAVAHRLFVGVNVELERVPRAWIDRALEAVDEEA